MLIRNVNEITKYVSPRHGEGTTYQAFFSMPYLHELIGIPPKRFAVAKRIEFFGVMTIEAGATNKRHIHEDVEQIYFILEGEGTVWVGDKKAEVRKGDAVFLPDRVSHGFYNSSDKPCVILLAGAKVTPGPEIAYARILDNP